MKTIQLDANAITDEASLHAEFDRTFQFPNYYGNNWNAWIDCMSSLSEPAGYMSSVHVEPNEELRLELLGGAHLRARCPDVFASLIECVDIVNWRYENRSLGCYITVDVVEGAE